jgi:hypothetical protein
MYRACYYFWNVDWTRTLARWRIEGGEMTDLEYCYNAGKDAGINGPNSTNCHFRLFSSREQTEAWERGKRDGDALKRQWDAHDISGAANAPTEEHDDRP